MLFAIFADMSTRACGAWLLDVPVWLSTDAWLFDVPVWLSVVVGRNRKKSRRFAEVTVAVSDICGFLLAPNGDTSTRACGRTDAWPFQGTASDSVGRTVAGHDSLPRLKAEGLIEVRRKRARAVLTMRCFTENEEVDAFDTGRCWREFLW